MEVRQAANVLELIEWFSRHGRPATLAEIADALGWPRSSGFNLIGTLVDRGYLYEPRTRGAYFPTSRWNVLTENFSIADPLPVEFEEVVRGLRDASAETVAIAVPAGTAALYRYVAEANASIRYAAVVGRRHPIQATSSGRALLAQYEPRERAVLYRKIDFAKYGELTPIDADMVEARLEAEVAQGFHVSNAEFSPDLLGVSVSLPFGDRKTALTIGGPRYRCLPRVAAFAELLADAVAQLSKRGLAVDKGPEPAR